MPKIGNLKPWLIFLGIVAILGLGLGLILSSNNSFSRSVKRNLENTIRKATVKNYLGLGSIYHFFNKDKIAWRPGWIIKDDPGQFIRYEIYGQVTKWDAAEQLLYVSLYSGPNVIVPIDFISDRPVTAYREYGERQDEGYLGGYTLPLPENSQAANDRSQQFCPQDILILAFLELDENSIKDGARLNPDLIYLDDRLCGLEQLQ